MKCVFSCCERVSRLDPQLAGIVRFGLKLIRHMWKASLPDVGLNKSVRHEPKRTIPANRGPRRETLPHFLFGLNFNNYYLNHTWDRKCFDGLWSLGNLDIVKKAIERLELFVMKLTIKIPSRVAKLPHHQQPAVS